MPSSAARGRVKLDSLVPRLSLSSSLAWSSLAFALLCARPRHAGADSNTVKGLIGGGALGAEIVLITESALRLRPGWVYLAGGSAGAAAGAYLGHELSDDGSNRPPSFLVAGAIALVIPSIMGVLTATQYAPPEPSPRTEPAPAEPAAAVPLESHLELPTLAVAQTFSRQQRVELGAPNVTELHLMLLRGAF